jgi:hypothetical protein
MALRFWTGLVEEDYEIVFWLLCVILKFHCRDCLLLHNVKQPHIAEWLGNGRELYQSDLHSSGDKSTLLLTWSDF